MASSATHEKYLLTIGILCLLEDCYGKTQQSTADLNMVNFSTSESIG